VCSSDLCGIWESVDGVVSLKAYCVIYLY